MAQITGGKITYGRTVKTGDYENKRVDVELSFSVGDGETYEEVFAVTAAQAHGKAHEMLGLRTTPLPVESSDPKPPTTDKEKLAAEVEAKVGKPASASRPRAAKPPAPAAAADPAAMDVVGEQKPPAPAAAANPAAFSEDELVGAAIEITDAEISAALARVNGATKNPARLRELIGVYAGAGKKSTDIPREKRAAFIEELKTVPKLDKAA